MKEHSQDKTAESPFEAYYQNFPEEVQAKLRTMETIISELVPLATKGISYGMPAFKTFGKPLVYFAAFKEHIGFYATPTGHEEFADELSAYKQGKGSVQFPLDQELPIDLIKRITQFRINENTKKYA